MARPRASRGYSCCYLQERTDPASPPGIALETAERLYAVARGARDALQGNEKGIALLQSALGLLFMLGNGTRVGAFWRGPMLAAVSLNSAALSSVGSGG